MGGCALLVIAPLRTNMVERCLVTDFDLKHAVEPGRNRTVFQQGHFSPRVQFDTMVQHCISDLCPTTIDKVYRL